MRRQLVAFCAVLGVTSAAVGLAKLEPKPDKYKDVDGCYIKELDTMIPFGEARPSSKECMEYWCDTDSVQYVTCGVVVVSPPYELVVYEDQPYPNCCPTVTPKKDILNTNSTTTIESTNKL